MKTHERFNTDGLTSTSTMRMMSKPARRLESFVTETDANPVCFFS